MLFLNDYRTIESVANGEYRDKGSLFLGWAIPVKNELEIKKQIDTIRKDHPKANHHCFAFALGPGHQAYRFSDDREPSGTAGRPIMGVLRSADLTDVLVVVVRYFGGTLLGVQGLINAYRTAAELALANATIITVLITEQYRISHPYSRTGEIEYLLKKSGCRVLERIQTEICQILVEVPRENSLQFYETLKNGHPFSLDCIIDRA